MDKKGRTLYIRNVSEQGVITISAEPDTFCFLINCLIKQTTPISSTQITLNLALTFTAKAGNI